jgi:hypothetical protein
MIITLEEIGERDYENRKIKRIIGNVTLSDQRERRVFEVLLKPTWKILHSAALRSE